MNKKALLYYHFRCNILRILYSNGDVEMLPLDMDALDIEFRASKSAFGYTGKNAYRAAKNLLERSHELIGEI